MKRVPEKGSVAAFAVYMNHTSRPPSPNVSGGEEIVALRYAQDRQGA